jgi:hypothetical protein
MKTFLCPQQKLFVIVKLIIHDEIKWGFELSPLYLDSN